MRLEIEFLALAPNFIHRFGDPNFEKKNIVYISFSTQSKSRTWQIHTPYIHKTIEIRVHTYINSYGYCTYISITVEKIVNSFRTHRTTTTTAKKYEKSRYLIKLVGCKCAILQVTKWLAHIYTHTHSHKHQFQ